MIIQFPTVRKLQITMNAMQRLGTVNEFVMLNQPITQREEQHAHTAHVQHLRLVVLLRHVAFQRSGLGEGVIALGALEGFLVRVGVHVSSQVARRGEVFVAMLTVVRCLWEMCEQMFLQVACLCEGFATTVAKERKNLRKGNNNITI